MYRAKAGAQNLTAWGDGVDSTFKKTLLDKIIYFFNKHAPMFYSNLVRLLIIRDTLCKIQFAFFFKEAIDDRFFIRELVSCIGIDKEWWFCGCLIDDQDIKSLFENEIVQYGHDEPKIVWIDSVLSLSQSAYEDVDCARVPLVSFCNTYMDKWGMIFSSKYLKHEVNLLFSKLNLFIGVNGSGKSSVLNSLRYPIGDKGRFISINRITENFCLDVMSESCVNEKLCLAGAKTLVTQSSLWVEKILGFEDGVDAVGAGYKSIFQVVVYGLISNFGESLIVENPEICLHPKAQSALVQFLVTVANTGVQVFMESHSDHVLNALCIAVLRKQLAAKDVSILHFQKNTEQIIQMIPIQEDGRIETWPVNFFD